jgi:hypothetical protein
VTASGPDHVRVAGAVIAISTVNGEVLWRCPLESLPWGCTLTQSPISPLLMLSRTKMRFPANRNRTKMLDVMAIDTRDGSAITTLDRTLDSFNNDIETRITLQPAQQRVVVNVGTLSLSYEFAMAEPDAELQPMEDPVDADD